MMALLAGSSAQAKCQVDGIYLGRDDFDNLHYAVRNSFNASYQNFKNEHWWYHNSVSFTRLDEGLGQIDFKITSNPITHLSTLVAKGTSRNIIDNPRHIKGLVFVADGISPNLNLTQAIYLVVVKEGCTVRK